MIASLFETALRELPDPLPKAELRALNNEEIRLLESRGNSSPDWSTVRVAEGSALDVISECRLSGEVHLALSWDSSPDAPEGFRPMLSGSNVEDCSFVGPVRVVGVGLLRGYVVEGCSVVERCGMVSCGPESSFGVGTPLSLGLETGERDVPSFPWLNVELAAALSGGASRSRLLPEYRRRLEELTSRRLSGLRGRIGGGCSVLDTPVVENSFLLGNVELVNASAIRDSFLMGDPDRPASVRDGAVLRSSVVQWGGRVDSCAVVEGSVVGESSTVQRHASLISSFLGPNSSLGEGEISASLVGPFVGAHHQSLLIAVRWPDGEGNVGYGANVGSNHTSRQPDQELECGQGVFFGLGCSIKYPASLLKAPFTVIATGVTTLPQVLKLPFSLVAQPFEVRPDLPPALNEVFPGWVISDNLYSLVRNERKYAGRNRAKRNPEYKRLLRSEVASWVESARETLRECSGREVYTGVAGAGKNFFTEASREKGIEAYTTYLGWFCLQAMFERIARLTGEGATAGEAEAEIMSDRSDMVARLVRGEYPGRDLSALLESYRQLCEQLKRSMVDSRRKDMDRGVRIVSDYSLVHSSEDALLDEMKRELDASYRSAARLLD
jgi:hypothetical protein